MGDRRCRFSAGLFVLLLGVFAAGEVHAKCKPPQVLCGGKCRYKDQCPKVPKVDPAIAACKKSKACKERGICKLDSKKQCRLVTPRSCKRSSECKVGGKCEPNPTRTGCGQSCPVGKSRTVDTNGQCCWQGQVWANGRCVGVPTSCPADLTLNPQSQSCEDPQCEVTGKQTANDGIRCCWPGQSWSRAKRACVGTPRCPEFHRVTKKGECRLDRAWKARYDSVAGVCRDNGGTVVKEVPICCWQGQAWSKIQKKCVGVPNRCPPDWVVKDGTCAPKADGVLQVLSSPAGQPVLLDGVAKGKTPLKLTLRPGTYTVTVGEGRMWTEQVVEVKPDETSLAEFQWGRLEVTSSVPGLAVLVDGEDVGKTPLSVAMTSRSLTVSVGFGLMQQSRRVEVQSGKTAKVDFRYGKLAIRSKPSGLQVRIAGQYKGSTPLTVDAAPGRYYVLVGQKLQKEQRNLVVEPGQTTRADFAPVDKSKANVTIVTEPPGADIRIKGRLVGKSPLLLRNQRVGSFVRYEASLDDDRYAGKDSFKVSRSKPKHTKKLKYERHLYGFGIGIRGAPLNSFDEDGAGFGVVANFSVNQAGPFYAYFEAGWMSQRLLDEDDVDTFHTSGEVSYAYRRYDPTCSLQERDSYSRTRTGLSCGDAHMAYIAVVQMVEDGLTLARNLDGVPPVFLGGGIGLGVYAELPYFVGGLLRLKAILVGLMSLTVDIRVSNGMNGEPMPSVVVGFGFRFDVAK